jgi:hypothetical protein
VINLVFRPLPNGLKLGRSAAQASFLHSGATPQAKHNGVFAHRPSPLQGAVGQPIYLHSYWSEIGKDNQSIGAWILLQAFSQVALWDWPGLMAGDS